jgi:hypothetical protein
MTDKELITLIGCALDLRISSVVRLQQVGVEGLEMVEVVEAARHRLSIKLQWISSRSLRDLLNLLHQTPLDYLLWAMATSARQKAVLR